MAKKSRPSFQKRQREMARQQRQQDKMARRLSKDSPAASQTLPSDVDPDIAGIVPGPQPRQEEWYENEPAEDEQSSKDH